MSPPKRELKYPHQIIDWLAEWGTELKVPGSMILIGSGALLWHAHEKGIDMPLSESSMDVDPITSDDCVAELAYRAIIGSEFEMTHGWHVNLMPLSVLSEFPSDWEARAQKSKYGKLSVTIPAAKDLLVPKLKRGEPRDIKHAEWAKQIGLET